jgi:hypothetical protein
VASFIKAIPRFTIAHGGGGFVVQPQAAARQSQAPRPYPCRQKAASRLRRDYLKIPTAGIRNPSGVFGSFNKPRALYR